MGMHAQIYNILEGVDLVAAVDKRQEESQEKLDRLGCQAKVYATLMRLWSRLNAISSTSVQGLICMKLFPSKPDAGKALFCEKL